MPRPPLDTEDLLLSADKYAETARRTSLVGFAQKAIDRYRAAGALDRAEALTEEMKQW